MASGAWLGAKPSSAAAAPTGQCRRRCARAWTGVPGAGILASQCTAELVSDSGVRTRREALAAPPAKTHCVAGFDRFWTTCRERRVAGSATAPAVPAAALRMTSLQQLTVIAVSVALAAWRVSFFFPHWPVPWCAPPKGPHIRAVLPRHSLPVLRFSSSLVFYGIYL